MKSSLEIQLDRYNLRVKSPYFIKGNYDALICGNGNNTIESKKQLVLNIQDLIDRLINEKEKLNIELQSNFNREQVAEHK
jgi:hypothetical protein